MKFHRIQKENEKHNDIFEQTTKTVATFKKRLFGKQVTSWIVWRDVRSLPAHHTFTCGEPHFTCGLTFGVSVSQTPQNFIDRRSIDIF